MINPVEKFHKFYCQKVLPLVYDDSLSYYEAVDKMREKVNEVIDALEGISEDILNQAKAYTDEKIAEQDAKIDAVVGELEQLVDDTVERLEQLVADTIRDFNAKLDEVDAKYDAFVRQVNATLTIFNNRINTLSDKIDSEIAGVNARTDLLIAQNNEYIFDTISDNLPNELKVVNMFTGARMSIQDMFNYLGNFHTVNAAIINNFGAYEHTVNEIVAIDADVTTWIMDGYDLLTTP